ncbi:MAG: alpha-D-ribose 1-methylphosphonate 5-triphosphate diphosphatase [Pseudomonadota bacterium]
MNRALLSNDAQSDDRTKAGDLCLANARLVLTNEILTGAVTVEGGVITEVAEGDDVPAGAIDCTGDFVIPGLVELHTDNLERHIEPRPGVDWPHLPALIAHDAELASVGITTVFDAMRAGSINDGTRRYSNYARSLATELLEARAGGHFKISHYIHLRAEICSETLLEELGEFGADDRVGILSLMDHTPGQRQFSDMGQMRKYVTKKRGMSDAEFDAHVANLQRLKERNGTCHENGAVKMAAQLGAVLASHDDTTAAHVATSAGHGVGFAEFPTTLEAAEACRDHGIQVMMGAPNLVRGASHSGNIAAEELARAGLLDIISSDYVPAGLLLSAFRLGEVWDDLPRAIACVTKNPARAAALLDRGVIEPGLRGDLLRVRHTAGVAIPRGVWREGIQIA